VSREEAADAGHFTTMQLRGGRVRGLDLHLDRLLAASRALYGSEPGRAVLLGRLRETLSAAGLLRGDCTARIRVLPPRRGCRSDAGPGAHDPALHIEVDIEPPRQPPASPLRVCTRSGLRPFPEVKHLALEFQHRARDEARRAGFDDVLLLAADGSISEGSFWNIAFQDGKGVVWPDAPALPGITARLLAEALERAGVPQRREAVRMETLAGLAAAFALNSTGIADIAAIDGHRFPGDAAAGAMWRRLLAQAPADLF
jgi:branched-subunit amino acid aminotransferase/4-amino-4-deoxychorismate lyase